MAWAYLPVIILPSTSLALLEVCLSKVNNSVLKKFNPQLNRFMEKWFQNYISNSTDYFSCRLKWIGIYEFWWNFIQRSFCRMYISFVHYDKISDHYFWELKVINILLRYVHIRLWMEFLFAFNSTIWYNSFLTFYFFPLLNI